MNASVDRPDPCLTLTPRAKPGIHSEELDDELVLYDAASSDSYLLNRTAAMLWRSLDGSISVQALIEELAEEFGLDSAEASTDVMELITKWTTAGLLTD